MSHAETLEVYRKIQVGDRIEVTREVRVGFQQWKTKTTGTVVRKERQRHSLHFRRNFDDKVFSDILVLREEDGELTTVTLDEFSELKIIESQSS
jgi:hypothetical protein